MKQILHTTLQVGLPKPVKLLQITDAHLTYTDETDPAETQALEKTRFGTFYEEGGQCPNTPYEYFEESIRLADELGALLICTGDMMDIQTSGNAAAFHKIVGTHDMLYTPGGHEHQKRCRRTMEEEDGYWRKSRKRLAEILPDYPLDFSHRVVGGMNLIMADNSLDYYNANTLACFKKEIERGLPMIVFGHDPINDEFLNATEKTHPNVELTPEDYARSHEMIDLIQTHPLVKAFVSGHNHDEEEGLLKNGNPWYVTPGLFAGICRLIEIV